MTQDLTQLVPAPAPRPGSNLPEFTVSELSAVLKRTVEEAFGFVRVRGEISQPKYHGSGHLYLTLKDERAVLASVCWKGSVGRLGLRAEEGMEVICTGRLTTFPGQSKYQLVIERMELAGEGALLKLLEERRRRLAAEGLFDAARKKRLPFLPAVIGVITSPTGAVIRDILHRLADRFPRHVLLWPVAVQGEAAAAQIAAAIEGFNRLPPGPDGTGGVPRPDLLIVARGGGSLEDLMPFNEEIVVRAAAASAIPLISAVGHETDTTLIDHAADRRAPTPTAAAEMAVPVRAELLADLLDREHRLVRCAAHAVEQRRMRVEGLARGLGDPQRLLEGSWQRLDDRAERLERAGTVLLERRRARVAELAARLRDPRPRLEEAARRLGQAAERLTAAGRTVLARPAERFRPVALRLSPMPVERALAEGAVRLADAGVRLPGAYGRVVEAAAARFAACDRLLESCSYQGVLRRGYVLVLDAEGHPVVTVAEAVPGRAVTLRFADGEAGAVIAEDGAAGTGTGSGGRAGRTRPAPAQGQRPGRERQGTLF